MLAAGRDGIGACLLAAFAVAFILHGRKGAFAPQLALYVVAVGFVMIHGRVPLRSLLGHVKQ